MQQNLMNKQKHSILQINKQKKTTNSYKHLLIMMYDEKRTNDKIIITKISRKFSITVPPTGDKISIPKNNNSIFFYFSIYSSLYIYYNC